MESVAFVFWICSAGVYGASVTYFFHRREHAATVSCSYLAIIALARPFIFFMGWDTPIPNGQFTNYWDLISLTSLCTILWMLVFMAAYRIGKPISTLASSLIPSVDRAPSMFGVRLVVLLAVATGLLLTGILIQQEGSIAKFMYDVKVGKNFSGLYAVRQISVLGGFMCLYGLLASASARDSRARQSKWRVSLTASSWIFFGLLFLVSLATNFLWGNRMNIALLLGASGLAFHIYVRRFSLKELAIALILAAILLQGLRVLREGLQQTVTGRESTSLESMSFVRGLSLSLHLAEYDALMLSVRDSGVRFDFRDGEDFYNGLVSWVPRQLWPDKPGTFHMGGWLRQVYEPNIVNGWPATLIGSWWVNFGLLGVIFGAVLSGTLMRSVDLRFSNSTVNPWHAVFAPVLGLFLFSGGGIDTGFMQDVFLTLLPLWLVAVYFNALSRPIPALRLPRGLPS